MPTPHPVVAVLAMRRVTKRELALAYGCTEHYVSRVLNGYIKPSAAFRAFVPEYLCLSADEVWSGQAEAVAS